MIRNDKTPTVAMLYLRDAVSYEGIGSSPCGLGFTKDKTRLSNKKRHSQ